VFPGLDGSLVGVVVAVAPWVRFCATLAHSRLGNLAHVPYILKRSVAMLTIKTEYTVVQDK